jgi:selenide, water dikinase
LNINFAEIPFISGAGKYARQGIFPGGAFDNKKHFESGVQFSATLDEANQMLLFDPQTSGGLLLGIRPQSLDSFVARARAIGQAISIIGSVETGTGIQVR